MEYKKNTAVANFPMGKFFNPSTMVEVTTGTPSGAFRADATAGTLTGSASYDATAKAWIWSLVQAAAMNGNSVTLTFDLDGCPGISYGISTTTKKVTELNDLSSATVLAQVTAGLLAWAKRSKGWKKVGSVWKFFVRNVGNTDDDVLQPLKADAAGTTDISDPATGTPILSAASEV